MYIVHTNGISDELSLKHDIFTHEKITIAMDIQYKKCTFCKVKLKRFINRTIHALLLVLNSWNFCHLKNYMLITSVAKRACSFNSSFAVISAADDICAFFNASSNSALTLFSMSRKLFVCDSASLVTFALDAFKSWFSAWRVVTWDLYCATSCSAVLSLLSVVFLNSLLIYGNKRLQGCIVHDQLKLTISFIIHTAWPPNQSFQTNFLDQL